MYNDKLIMGSIIGTGVLVSLLVIGTEISTPATLLVSELNMDSESSHEITLEDYPDYLKDNFRFSFQYDQAKVKLDSYEDELAETEVIEVPVVKRMVFQFKRPVKLEFS
jgi:hypothetical protein